MPFRRCRNFESNGSRKTWAHGAEMECRTDCQFIHPSDPDWDRAPTVFMRGRGGPPRGGRGRGQSSFGPPATGANAFATGQERGSSSGTWNDYMTGFDRNPRATSSSKGAPSHRSGQTRPESSGWGSSGADGPGWGSSANNNENPSNGWSNEPGASVAPADTQAGGWGSSGDGWGSSANGPPPSGDGWGSSANMPPPSGDGWGSSANMPPPSGDGWGSSANGPPPSDDEWGSSGNGFESSGNAWGSSGNTLASSGNGWGSFGNDLGSGGGWGSAGTDQGPGWGETSISDQGSKIPSAGAAAKLAEPDAALGGTGVDGIFDTAMATTRSSRVSVPVAPASQTDIQGSGGAKPVRVVISSSIPTSGELDLTRNEGRGEDTFEPPPLASKLIKMQPPHVDQDDHIISTLSDTDSMGFAIAVALKMRELDAELSQLSALRKSRQVGATRAAKELLQDKVNNFADTRMATEAERNFCSEKLARPNFFCRSNVQHASATLGRENEQLERLKDWVSRAETCLSHVRPPSRPNSPMKVNGITSDSKLDQLKERSESLAENILQCHDQQIYNTFLDHQTQEKMDSIVSAIVKSLDISHNHLVTTSFIPLQTQEEMWQQTLQSQAEKFAQLLLQSDQLKIEQENRFSFKQKEKGVIQQLQADIDQKKLQLQALQEEIAQMHHSLTSMKQQSKNSTIINTMDEYTKHIQEYIQRYISANTTLPINAELSKAMVQFTAAELKTVEKVWKTLQPLSQMSLWLQHSNLYKTKEEMEIREIEEREIEETLLA